MLRGKRAGRRMWQFSCLHVLIQITAIDLKVHISSARYHLEHVNKTKLFAGPARRAWRQDKISQPTRLCRHHDAKDRGAASHKPFGGPKRSRKFATI
jgi:hypothetical protein